MILTRHTVIDALNEIIVVPATRNVRGLSTEVLLTAEDGIRQVFNLDRVALAQRGRLRGRLD